MHNTGKDSGEMSRLGFLVPKWEAYISIAKGMARQCTGGCEMLPTIMQWCWRLTSTYPRRSSLLISV